MLVWQYDGLRKEKRRFVKTAVKTFPVLGYVMKIFRHFNTRFQKHLFIVKLE